MDMKIVVLDGCAANSGDISWDSIGKYGELTVYDRTDRSEVVSRIGDAEIITTNKTVIDRAVIEACPNLRYIGVLATGYNVVDVEAAHEHGIVVTNVPAYSTDAVAQFTFALLLELANRVGAHDASVKDGGWVDLVALRYAIMVNGVTQLILMKSDVLDGFDTIKACVAYKVNGEEIDYFPYDITEGVEPVYAELPGWKTDMTKMTSEDEFPEEFNAYITFLEEQLGTPIKIVSVGPDRAQTIERYID